MAKEKHCVFCDKQLEGGFFSSKVKTLEVGHSKMLLCCPECYAKYEMLSADFNKRFGAKLTNAKRKSGKKMSDKEVAQAYAAYVQQYAAHPAVDVEPGLLVAGCFIIGENGYFSVKEHSNAFVKSDVSARDMLRTARKATKGEQIWFTKDDISKIEYFQNGSGDFVGLFHKAYSFSIRLNDETVITYKPAITRASALGGGFMFGYKANARKKLEADLMTFRTLIGSDLPIRYVRK